jgi:hypothetical protein
MGVHCRCGHGRTHSRWRAQPAEASTAERKVWQKPIAIRQCEQCFLSQLCGRACVNRRAGLRMSAAASQAALGRRGRRMCSAGAIRSRWWAAGLQACSQPWRLQKLASRQEVHQRPNQLPTSSGPEGHKGPLLMGGGRAQVVLLERGQPVEQRGRDIGALFARGIINPDSNLCYGQSAPHLADWCQLAASMLSCESLH